MKEVSKSKEIEWLGSNYRITYHLGSRTIRLEERTERFWGAATIYKTIYFGHINPLEEVVKFWKEQ